MSFARGFLRLRARGRTDLAGWDRAALFALALALGMAALVSPLDEAAEEYLLSAHMLQHVLIGDLAVALAVVALRGPLLFFVVPPRLGRMWARVGPLPSFAVWAIALAAWHLPPAYEYALEHPAVHGLEHACFILGGVLVWMQLVDPARRGALSLWGGLGFALAVFVTGQFLANTLILTDHVVYPSYAEQPVRLFGLSPQSDQDTAGLVMMVEQLATLGTFAVLRLRRYAREPLVLREDGHPLAL